MQNRHTIIILLSLIILSLVLGIFSYPQLPDNIASHWDINGQADDTMPKFWGIFLMPIVLIALFLLYLIVPVIDPLKTNLKLFRKQYNIFWIATSGFLFYIFLMILVWNFNYQFNFTMALSPAIATLLWTVGWLLRSTKRNWFVGIRTPWTLSDDTVWEKTNTLGGKLFQVAGIIALAGLPFPNALPYLIFIPIVIIALGTIIYSAVIHRRLHR